MNWDTIKVDVAGLKELVTRSVGIIEGQDAAVASLKADLAKVQADLAAALARDTLDPVELQAVHDDLVAFALEVEGKLHVRGM